MTYRVAVDHDLCMSSRDCTRIAPEAFVLDEDGLSVPTAGAGSVDLDRLLDAAFSCPVNAIRITDADGAVLHQSG